MIKYAKIVPIFLCLLCGGCTQSPVVHFYVLESLNPAASSFEASNSHRSIGVGPITLPKLLQNKKIVTRISGNRVKIAESHQWASSLEDNFLQVLTQNLTHLQLGAVFRAYPWSVHGMVDRQIIIDVIRFDATPGVSVDLTADWTIKNETSHEVINRGHSALKRSLADTSYPGAVTGLNNVLADFSRELSSALIAAELRK